MVSQHVRHALPVRTASKGRCIPYSATKEAIQRKARHRASPVTRDYRALEVQLIQVIVIIVYLVLFLARMELAKTVVPIRRLHPVRRLFATAALIIHGALKNQPPALHINHSLNVSRPSHRAAQR